MFESWLKYLNIFPNNEFSWKRILICFLFEISRIKNGRELIINVYSLFSIIRNVYCLKYSLDVWESTNLRDCLRLFIELLPCYQILFYSDLICYFVSIWIEKLHSRQIHPLHSSLFNHRGKMFLAKSLGLSAIGYPNIWDFLILFCIGFLRIWILSPIFLVSECNFFLLARGSLDKLSNGNSWF